LRSKLRSAALEEEFEQAKRAAQALRGLRGTQTGLNIL
jgi:hypothetical protein